MLQRLYNSRLEEKEEGSDMPNGYELSDIYNQLEALNMRMEALMPLLALSSIATASEERKGEVIVLMRAIYQLGLPFVRESLEPFAMLYGFEDDQSGR